MDFLDFIPKYIFEWFGMVAGFFACLTIALQLIKEARESRASSLSLLYVCGWFFIFMFWLLYGIRFRTWAIVLSNFIAVILQFALSIIVIKKRKEYE